MSFITETAEGLLHLTDAEKAVVNAALPTLAEDVAAINAHQDSIRAAVALFVKAAPVLYRLLDDYKILGPILHDILDGSGSIFSIGGAVSSGKDIQATIAANPYLVGEIRRLYADLAPLVVKLINDSPQTGLALRIIMSKMGVAGS